jgi:hypothetical protein
MLTKAILFIFLLIGMSISQEDSTYKTIIDKHYYNKSSIIVLDHNHMFNGYMVFKIYKNPDIGIYNTNSKYYVCDIFWVEQINHIDDVNKHYQYVWSSAMYEVYYGENLNLNNTDSMDAEFLSFKKFNDRFWDFQKLNCTEYPFLYEPLITEIFKNNIIFWQYKEIDSVGYYIFSNSFSGTLLQTNLAFRDYSNPLNRSNDDYREVVISNGKIIVPMTKTCDFQPAGSDVLSNYNFVVSKWLPQDLYNK